MKKRLLIIAVVCTAAAIAILLVALACPQAAATRKSYLDINTGRLRVQWVGVTRVYRESIEETDFSTLLKNHGLAEGPTEWRLANVEELGIRRLFFPQHVTYAYGKIAA